MNFSRQSNTEVRLLRVSNPMISLRSMCADNISEMTVGTGAGVIGMSADVNASFEQFSDLPSRHATQLPYKSASPASRSDLPNASGYDRRNRPVTGSCSSENNYGLPDGASMRGNF
jgi:hypothetical protein